MDPVLIALATAAGTSVVQAAGTDVWTGFRERVARLFGRGRAGEAATQVTLERLDRTAGEITTADDGGTELVREQAAAVWRTRFQDLLEEAGGDRDTVVAELRELVATAEQATAGVSASGDAVAIGGNVHLNPTNNSVAAVKMGNVTLGAPANPPAPGAATS
ncbi:hypothetical protein [Kitasatospora herbaricolor]|uniref:hypothetical protein n=1 Tax=Kitasatospora herbaricolor TaxID=68217 RepID=UPI0036D95141